MSSLYILWIWKDKLFESFFFFRFYSLSVKGIHNTFIYLYCISLILSYFAEAFFFFLFSHAECIFLWYIILNVWRFKGFGRKLLESWKKKEEWWLIFGDVFFFLLPNNLFDNIFILFADYTIVVFCVLFGSCHLWAYPCVHIIFVKENFLTLCWNKSSVQNRAVNTFQKFFALKFDKFFFDISTRIEKM